MSEDCRQHGCCMCVDTAVNYKPHLQCCNCGRKKLKPAETPHKCAPCTLLHYAVGIPQQNTYFPGNTITWANHLT